MRVPPGPDIGEHAVLAEALGYERAWVYDSPALYPDVWVTLARIAERTDRIGLGPAVLVPSLRHVLTQATAIATLEGIAPGRTVAAVGTGFTGRMALGQRPLPSRDVESYVRNLRTLLRGGDTLAAFTWTGPAGQLRERLDQLETCGGTEILYAPMGPDIPRELRAFAAMAGLAS